jgi:hypothetical protein
MRPDVSEAFLATKETYEISNFYQIRNLRGITAA